MKHIAITLNIKFKGNLTKSDIHFEIEQFINNLGVKNDLINQKNIQIDIIKDKNLATKNAIYQKYNPITIIEMIENA